MAPKSKAKAKAGAAKAKPKAAVAKAKAAAGTSPGSPAAGSGAAAVRQSRLDAEAAAEAASAAEAKAQSDEKATPSAESEERPADAAACSAATKDACSAATKDEDKGSDAGSADAVAAAADPDSAAAATVDLSDFADPWESLGEEAAMVKIREEDWEVIEADGATPAGPSHLAARDADLPGFNASEGHRRWLVSADLAGNAIESVAAAGAPLWLRMLCLANNPLSSLAGLAEGFPRLMALDVSFVDLASVDGAWRALASCECLRRLTAEGCGVSSCEDLEPMPKLRMLELMDNGMEEFEEVATLAGKCPGIEELDLRENDVTTTGNYVKKVKALFPKLTFLDNQSQKAYVAKRQDEAYKGIDGMNKEIMAVDGMYKNESCSCLEGNPCLDPATCKDWKNREKVAQEARKRKALRDDSGKICD